MPLQSITHLSNLCIIPCKGTVWRDATITYIPPDSAPLQSILHTLDECSAPNPNHIVCVDSKPVTSRCIMQDYGTHNLVCPPPPLLVCDLRLFGVQVECHENMAFNSKCIRYICSICSLNRKALLPNANYLCPSVCRCMKGTQTTRLYVWYVKVL